MNCQECRTKLDIHLDGELAAAEMRALDEHVRACPACAAEVLRKVQLKRAIQNAGRRYVPSPEFRERVRKSVAAPPRRSLARVWATAGALVLIIAGFVLAYQRQQRLERDQVLSEVADLHVITLASANPVDVVSTDRHTVKPWFQGKVPFTFNLPELQNTDFTLLGGRVAYLGQTPAAELLFQVRQHRISVFIAQPQSIPLPAGLHKAKSFNLETWSTGGLTYCLISDVDPADIHRLSELLKRAAG